jgi:transcription elongation factor Elf1
MKSTTKKAEKTTANCGCCGRVFELKPSKSYGPVALRKYCSEKCKRETFKVKQQAKIEATRLAEKLLQEEAKKPEKRVNVYREVHRKAREFAGVGKKAY